MSPGAFRITPEKAVFSEHILDVFGGQFRFDHPKGLAEWIKNSIDAYLVEETPDDHQHVIIRVVLGKPKKNSVFEVIDFVGMTSDDIENAFKRWGDPAAARKGTEAKTLGGHGNGGKFYMREMFDQAHFITYRKGLINVFGFTNKRYGYDRSFKDQRMRPDEALEFAGISHLEFPPGIQKRKGKAIRFTVVRGRMPKNWRGRSTADGLAEGLRFHPQVRRLLKNRPISFVKNNDPIPRRLKAEKIEPLEGFERGFSIEVPPSLTDPETGDDVDMTMNERFEPGLLVIETSKNAFHGSRLTPLNCIDIRGDLSVLASYHLSDIASFGGSIMPNAAQAEFLYGDCLCESLDDRDLETDEICVQNDRERLVETAPRSRALLTWIKGQVTTFAATIAGEQQKSRRREQMETTSQLNQFLNQWKNKFMDKVYAEIWAGPFEGAGAGGVGGGAGTSQGKGKKAKTKSEDAGPKDDEEKGGGSGDEKKRGPRHYKVLLSNHDPDPLSDIGDPFPLTDRHPPVHQRAQDVQQGIYWINTQTALANAIYDRFGFDSSRWRDYMFQRHVDIIIHQAILDLPAHGQELTPDSITNIRDEISTRIFQFAATDLESFLFA